LNFTDISPFVRQALVGTLNKSNTRDVNVKIKTVDCRLFCIISGGGSMTIDGIRHPIGAGTVLLFSAGTEYIWEIEDVRYYSVNFDYTAEFSHIKKTFHPIHSSVFSDGQIIHRPYFDDLDTMNRPIVVRGTPALNGLIEQLTTEYCMAGRYSDMLTSSLLRAALLTVLRIHTAESTSEKRICESAVRTVVEYINNNYDRDITNESISRLYHFNSSYLNRIFKACTGQTMHSFLLSRRLAAAMEMLRSQNIPISEVAYMCGFQSIHHFSKTFKKCVGMSPSEYRDFNS